jgi:hypothetical protein
MVGDAEASLLSPSQEEIDIENCSSTDRLTNTQTWGRLATTSGFLITHLACSSHAQFQCEPLGLMVRDATRESG